MLAFQAKELPGAPANVFEPYRFREYRRTSNRMERIMDPTHATLSEETIAWCKKHRREDAPLFVCIFIEQDQSATVENPAAEWPAVVGLRFAAEGANWSDQIAHFVVKHETGGEELTLEEEIARDVIVTYEKYRHHADEAMRLLNKLGIAAVRAP